MKLGILIQNSSFFLFSRVASRVERKVRELLKVIKKLLKLGRFECSNALNCQFFQQNLTPVVRYPCDGDLQAEMWDSRYEEKEECKNLLCEVQKFVRFFFFRLKLLFGQLVLEEDWI